MSKHSQHKPLRGIIPPMVTPLKDRDNLDIEGLEKLVEHILAGGVHGLFILGTTGEAPSLNYKLRAELIDRVCKQVAGRIPVVVGITDTVYANSIEITNLAEKAGAEAVVLAPPYYFASGQMELLEYLEDLTAELSLPLYLYNMPSLTKTVFEIQTVVTMAAEIDGIYGLKDSSGDMIYFNKLQRALKDKKDFSLLTGPEELLAETLFVGGDGGVNGGANFNPKLYVNLYNAAQKNDWVTVQKLHKTIIEISSSIYAVGRHQSRVLKGIKCSLSCMGICSDAMAEPFRAFREEERHIVKSHLRKLRLL